MDCSVFLWGFAGSWLAVGQLSAYQVACIPEKGLPRTCP